ncbi:hypothetical protein [Terrarubrum flagellatum]|uniref:hypothetical protein n=1 Tax=Terrirubrum flagellatum TaxID=2895980 RepID=UPI0031451912
MLEQELRPLIPALIDDASKCEVCELRSEMKQKLQMSALNEKIAPRVAANVAYGRLMVAL